MWWGFLVLGSKQHCGYCVITSIAVSDAEDLGCSVAVPDSQQPVAAIWVVKDSLVDDVVGIACIALVSTEMGGDDDCEVVTTPLKTKGAWVGFGCPRFNTFFHLVLYA